jgi:glycerol uptake facilitator-like aquaporin
MYRPEHMDEGRAAGKPAHPPNGDHMDRRRSSAYAAEAIGTFLLVLFIVLILAVNAKAGVGALAAAFAYQAIVIQDGPSVRPVDKIGGP